MLVRSSERTVNSDEVTMLLISGRTNGVCDWSAAQLSPKAPFGSSGTVALKNSDSGSVE